MLPSTHTNQRDYRIRDDFFPSLVGMAPNQIILRLERSLQIYKATRPSAMVRQRMTERPDAGSN